MKIVTYDEFVRMPAGTIFAPWTPCAYKDEFEIKVDGGHSYINRYSGKECWGFNGTMPVFPYANDDWCFRGVGPIHSEMYLYDGSNADYDDDELFAVMEEKDIRKMIEALEWALKGCTGDFDTEIHSGET